MTSRGKAMRRIERETHGQKWSTTTIAMTKFGFNIEGWQWPRGAMIFTEKMEKERSCVRGERGG
jgi:hypothetical protein